MCRSCDVRTDFNNAVRTVCVRQCEAVQKPADESLSERLIEDEDRNDGFIVNDTIVDVSVTSKNDQFLGCRDV